MKRTLAVLIILLTAVTPIVVTTVNAQSIPKPTAPEFTLKYIKNVYHVAPTYTIDPFTGENKTTDFGGTFENQTIEVSIKNQQFIPYTDSNGSNIRLYYNFRFRGSYGGDWVTYPYEGSHTSSWSPLFPASNSENTVVSIPLSEIANRLTKFQMETFPAGSQIDIQMQAMIGYTKITDLMLFSSYYDLVGEISDWSNTQTLTLADDSVSNSTSPSPSPTVPEFSALTLLPLLAVTVGFVAAKQFRKHAKSL